LTRIFAHSGSELRVHLGNAARCFPQSFALGVFAHTLEDQTHTASDAIEIDFAGSSRLLPLPFYGGKFCAHYCSPSRPLYHLRTASVNSEGCWFQFLPASSLRSVSKFTPLMRSFLTQRMQRSSQRFAEEKPSFAILC